jgi:bacteriorhodopsin
VSGLVVTIACYHYFMIRHSWHDAYSLVGGGYKGTGAAFNDFYRYADWILTVPLLMVELVSVLRLPTAKATSLLTRLVIAAALMIALGYPGEVIADPSRWSERVMWGGLSSIPFFYILYVLFVELTKSLDRQPAGVADTVKRLRLLLIATWGVYPISYILGMTGDPTASSFVGVQVGYTLADILAKCVFGLTILKIARMKSHAEGMAADH